jgi:hypothetical protein
VRLLERDRAFAQERRPARQGKRGGDADDRLERGASAAEVVGETDHCGRSLGDRDPVAAAVLRRTTEVGEGAEEGADVASYDLRHLARDQGVDPRQGEREPNRAWSHARRGAPGNAAQDDARMSLSELARALECPQEDGLRAQKPHGQLGVEQKRPVELESGADRHLVGGDRAELRDAQRRHCYAS